MIIQYNRFRCLFKEMDLQLVYPISLIRQCVTWLEFLEKRKLGRVAMRVF